jgi:hypothetical protein
MTPHEALNLIANGLPHDIVKWARLNEVEPEIVQKLEHYTPTWHATAEHRGALVYTFRRIAEKALDTVWNNESVSR